MHSHARHTGEIVHRLFAETPRQHGFRERMGRVRDLRGCDHTDQECRCARTVPLEIIVGGIRYMEKTQSPTRNERNAHQEAN